MNGDSTKLVGVWEIFQTKEPGKPYRQAYKGRSFVSRGVHAFTLILEYRGDGTFRRVSQIGNDEKVQDGTWKFSGNELRHKRNGVIEEENICPVRFDSTKPILHELRCSRTLTIRDCLPSSSDSSDLFQVGRLSVANR